MTDLDKLIESVEAGSLHYDRDLYAMCQNCNLPEERVWSCYRGSLDAAKALHEALVPEWDVNICMLGAAEVRHPNFRARDKEAVCKNNPARAWLLAILKAYHAGA